MAAILKNISLPKDPFDSYWKSERSQIIHWESKPPQKAPWNNRGAAEGQHFCAQKKTF